MKRLPYTLFLSVWPVGALFAGFSAVYEADHGRALMVAVDLAFMATLAAVALTFSVTRHRTAVLRQEAKWTRAALLHAATASRLPSDDGQLPGESGPVVDE